MRPAPEWLYLKDFKPAEICKCVSVGFLLHDGPDKKVLAPNMANIEDEHSIQGSGIIHIPTRCVTRMVRIEELNEPITSSA